MEDGEFIANSSEKRTMKDFKWCHDLFSHLGISINHFIILIGGGAIRSRVRVSIQEKYCALIERLVDIIALDALVFVREPPVPDQCFDDILCGRERLEFEARRFLHNCSMQEALEDARINIATNIAEAKKLVHDFGDFLIITVESPDRYQFHNLGVSQFTDRLLPITQFYPWRTK